MSVEIRDKRFANVVGSSLTFECLADNFLFTEGPVWDAAQRRLIFSDIPADTMYQWTRSKGVEEFRKPSNKSNGLTWDCEGRLLSCEHATSRVTRLESNGQLSVIASTYNGRELNSPNDIVVKSDGAIYFTDPTYGRIEYYGVPREPQLGFRAVYRLDPQGGELTLLADDFAQPNGLCFSSDEQSAVRQRHRARAYPGVRRTQRRHVSRRTRFCSVDRRRRGRAGRNENRQQRQPLLLRSWRHPHFRQLGELSRSDPCSEAGSQLQLGRRRSRKPVYHCKREPLPDRCSRSGPTRATWRRGDGDAVTAGLHGLPAWSEFSLLGVIRGAC